MRWFFCAVEFGIADGIIMEPLGGAHKDIETQSLEIKKTFEKSLNELLLLSKEELVNERYKKFRKIGKLSN